MHICLSKFIIIDWDNSLLPVPCQAIIWNNAGIFSIQTLETKVNEILSKIQTFSLKKMHLKMLSEKWWPLWLIVECSKIKNMDCTHKRHLISHTQWWEMMCLFWVFWRKLNVPDSKVDGANMGPIWGRQVPGGPHVGPINLAIWGVIGQLLVLSNKKTHQSCALLALYEGNPLVTASFPHREPMKQKVFPHYHVMIAHWPDFCASFTILIYVSCITISCKSVFTVNCNMILLRWLHVVLNTLHLLGPNSI